MSPERPQELGSARRRGDVIDHCHICGSMVDDFDWDRHRAWHALLASTVSELNDDLMKREWACMVENENG